MRRSKGRSPMLRAFCAAQLAILPFVFLASCATAPSLPPPPPKYVMEEKTAPAPENYTNNSLWVEQASLYEDLRARRLNDLVTIDVLENISGTGQADTNTARTSSLNASVDKFFGAPLNGNFNNLYGGGYSFAPSLSGQMQDSFKGTGTTDRSGTLVGTITAKVVQVMPNGNLLLEARKEITINDEKQTLVFQGMARPYDIASDNTIASTRITDAKIYFVGDGVLQEKQGPGWLARFIDKVWPF